MYIGGEKLHFILSDFSFKRRNWSPIWIIQWNLLNFQCGVGCLPMPVCLWHAKKDTIYARIVHRWIANRWNLYHELAKPCKNLFFWESLFFFFTKESRVYKFRCQLFFSLICFTFLYWKLCFLVFLNRISNTNIIFSWRYKCKT